jgi:DNA-binding CsgD family transcriptional regulator
MAAVFCLLVPFFAGADLSVPYQWQPTVVVASRAVFAAIGFLLLYNSVPHGQEGFFIAIAFASYDLLWTLLSPLLGLVSPQLPDLYAVYLYYICCWMIGVAGLLFAIALWRSRQDLPQAQSQCQQNSPAIIRQKWQFFALLLTSSVGVFLLIGIMLEVPIVVGLLLDVSQPKFSMQPQVIDALYIMLLLCLPLAGRLLDRSPDKAIVMCIAALVAVVSLSLVNIDNKLLSYLLDVVRLFFWIAAHATVAKLFRGQGVLILLIIAVYLLLPMQFVGVALRSLSPSLPLITVMVITCLFFARRRLLESNLWAMPDQQSASDQDLQPTRNQPVMDDKLLSFAAAHELTARERDVLQCLLKDGSRETVSNSLALSARTVRYHISNLQKKLSLPNERSIVDYYSLWKLK